MSIEKTLLSKNEIIKSIKDNDLVIDVGGQSVLVQEQII